MPRNGEPTRQKILDAAERVIADVGVDAATFAEINAKAGQRNNSATQYHFGDRIALLQAVIERHSTAIAEKRSQYVASLSDDADLIELVHALIDPIAHCLDDESGRRYLIIQASLLSHPDRSAWPDDLVRPWTRPGVDQLTADLEASVGRPVVNTYATLKREMVSLLMFHSMANEARQTSPGADHTVFVAGLVAALAALIGADLSV